MDTSPSGRLRSWCWPTFTRPPATWSVIPLVRAQTGVLMDQCAAIATAGYAVIFHLAGAVSSACEADLDLGLRSNIDTTRALLDALRAGSKTRFVFSSSVAVFGGNADLPMPRVIRDETLPVPQSSYGIQKFICEQLVADYTRRGLIDGRSTRLSTVSVRPGQPNAAASSFLSSIVREPLQGKPAICPVSLETEASIIGPQRAIECLIAAGETTQEAWGGPTALNLPALSVRVSEILDAVETVGGRAARDLVRLEPDATIARLVAGWPATFKSTRAQRLGLAPDPDFLSIVRQFHQELPEAR